MRLRFQTRLQNGRQPPPLSFPATRQHSQGRRSLFPLINHQDPRRKQKSGKQLSGSHLELKSISKAIVSLFQSQGQLTGRQICEELTAQYRGSDFKEGAVEQNERDSNIYRRVCTVLRTLKDVDMVEQYGEMFRLATGESVIRREERRMSRRRQRLKRKRRHFEQLKKYKELLGQLFKRNSSERKSRRRRAFPLPLFIIADNPSSCIIKMDHELQVITTRGRLMADLEILSALLD